MPYQARTTQIKTNQKITSPSQWSRHQVDIFLHQSIGLPSLSLFSGERPNVGVQPVGQFRILRFQFQTLLPSRQGFLLLPKFQVYLTQMLKDLLFRHARGRPLQEEQRLFRAAQLEDSPTE